MLVIRFLRTGKKNQPSFKIVVVEKTKSSTSGSFIEAVGFYNPLTKEKVLKQDRIKYWISVGAQPLETVHNLLVSENIIEGKKIDVHNKPKKSEEDKSSSSVSPSEEGSAKQGEETPAETVKPAEAAVAQAPAKEAPKETVKEESPKEEIKKEAAPEASPVEEKKEEAAAPETLAKEEVIELAAPKTETPKEESIKPAEASDEKPAEPKP